ncbi:hypothetical protein EMIHUDRAFT_458337 [Emiliania huxleyi CCMP1516]|uniref:BTB domain-containing protein n=2 Tax=Emiliania huxleyi TaxID=2903 RepID=A0A0D3JDE4_EMIH1|nr:hypothetical protein EMIHUDRAFT_458337 [Emiliania huxleyi CCMP1516]EOD21529.1 hypothetical protein EMIHUDRAFT_458337 [Emiliania huxleyi CCMP1516]|eukprot:XP_005773958.1 hypothetical protein EMIHUDRAFT_458337 [Emiliania huxleyi CCMP1516]
MLDTVNMTLTYPQVLQDAEGRSTTPDDREGHTASVVDQQIYIFGGTWEDEKTGVNAYLDDLHVFDVASYSWMKPAYTGSPPEGREGHSAAVIGRLIFIFGGTRGTWVQEAERTPHRELEDEGESAHGQLPSQREGHSACVVGCATGGVWWGPFTAGDSFLERRYHTASVVEGRLLVFGGQYYDYGKDLHFECSNAVCEIDLEQLAWRIHPPSSPSPLKRACHAAGVVGKCVYVVGGRYWDEQEDDYIFLNDVLDTRPSSSLASDWRRYFNSELLSDVCLLVGDMRIPAHRVVLAARCDFFARMFASGMREATEEELPIVDVSPPVFQLLLEHLYTDSSAVPEESALELFAAADRFGVERLRALCSDRIEGMLSAANVCDVLTVADQHNGAELVEAAVSHIVENFGEIHCSPPFRELSRPLLDVVHAAIAPRLVLAAPPAGLAAEAGGSRQSARRHST